MNTTVFFALVKKNVRASSTHSKKLAGLTAALYVEATKTKTLGIALTFLIACIFFKSIPTVEFVKTY